MLRWPPPSTARRARSEHDRGSPRTRRSRRVRDRDRRAGQGGLGAALPRRRHRGDRRAHPVREGLGAADRRHVRPRPAAGRALQPPDPHRRRARRRPGGGRDAGAGVRHAPDLRHLRRAGPRGPQPGRGHGAVVRRAVRARARPAGRPAARGRQGRHARRTVPDPLEGRGGPAARQGDRRLLELRGRARHERLDVHRPGDHLDRCRRGGRVLRRDRRDERPAARRRPVAGARHDRARSRRAATPRRTSRGCSTTASG